MAYSKDYWLKHYEYVMGHKERQEGDNSNADWTRKNLEKILSNKRPYGMTGTNGAKALIEYVEKYHPEKKVSVVNLMIAYVESIQTPATPYNRLYTYYRSL